MTMMALWVLFITNFIILSIFATFLLRAYNKRRCALEDIADRKLRMEREKIEELNNDMLRVSELWLEKMDQKERKMKILIDKIGQRIIQTQTNKVPIGRGLATTVKTVTQLPAENTKDIHQIKKHYLGEDAKFKEIYYLADKGMGLVDLARKTGKSKGEIELVLSLRKAKQYSS